MMVKAYLGIGDSASKEEPVPIAMLLQALPETARPLLGDLTRTNTLSIGEPAIV